MVQEFFTVDAEIIDLRREVEWLKRQLAGASAGVTARELLGRGQLVVRLGDAARTDTAGVPNGAVSFYISGATIRMQVFDMAAAAWREVSLT